MAYDLGGAPAGEEASTTLKIAMLVFSIILVLALGIMVWKQNTTTVNDDTAIITGKTTATVTATSTVRATATVNVTATARARATATALATSTATQTPTATILATVTTTAE